MKLSWPARVTIVEVGPRDGLQNEPAQVPTAEKIAFIHALAESGLTHIEAGSFVHPRNIPQLADSADVFAGLTRAPGVVYSALVPNMRGFERARECRVPRVAVFTAASETFTQRNINMTIAESLDAFRPVAAAARQAGITLRGYISTSFVCPFEGDIDKRKVLDVAQALFEMGADEVAVSDTIGAAAPSDVFDTVGFLTQSLPPQRLALHFHDTCGTALANVTAGMQLGITTFDASAGGLGGCPFAPGAAGNLATEDLVSMLDRMGIPSGVNLARLCQAVERVEPFLSRRLSSRQLQRYRFASKAKDAGPVSGPPAGPMPAAASTATPSTPA